MVAAVAAAAVLAGGTPAVAGPPHRPAAADRTAGAAAVVQASASLGDRAPFTMIRRNLSDRSQLAINAGSGNVVYSQTLFHVSGVGQDLDIRLYNNSGSTTSRTFANGFTLSVGQDVYLSYSTGGDVTYHAPDGSLFTFTRQSDGSYTAPSAVNAKLSTSDQATFTLRFNKTGITDTFSGGQVTGAPAGTSEALITQSADRDGNKISFSYTVPAGASVKKVSSITDTQGRTFTFTYESLPTAPLAEIDDVAGKRSVRFAYFDDVTGGNTLQSVGNQRLTAFGYATGGLNRITVPDGHQTTIEYGDSADPHRATAVTYGDDAADRSRTTFAYPDDSTTKVTDPLSHTTTYTHDSHARVTKVVDPLNHSRQRSYTANDDPSTLTDAASAVTHLSYDNQNNLTKIQAPDVAGGAAGSGRSTLLGYPAPTGALSDFQPTSSTDAQANKTTYAYNAGGRVSSVSTAAGAGGTLTDKHQGDSGVDCGARKGELCSSTDGNGHTTSYGYDPAGNLTKVTPPAPLGATTIVPDAVGRPSQVTDGKGQVTTYVYDDADRITEIRYGGATTCNTSSDTCIRYGYDGEGHVTSRTDSGASTTFSYDAQGRLRTKVLTPTGGPTQTYRLGYDLAGNLTSSADPLGEVDYGYDAANRVTTLAEPGGSCPAKPTFPNTTHCTTFSYDSNDHRTEIDYPTGQVDTYKYDTSGRMTEVTAKSGSTTLRSYTYSYSKNGVDTDLLQSTTSNTNSGPPAVYSYDQVNRIKQQVNGSTTRTWTYDKAGNRLTNGITGSPTTNYAYNAADELCWSASTAGSACGSPPSGATTFGYDANGNLTAENVADLGTDTFGYNVKNQMTVQNGAAETYTDADSTERLTATDEAFYNSPIGVTARIIVPQTTAPNCGCGEDTSPVGYTRDPNGTLISLRKYDGSTGNYDSSYYTLDPQGSVLQHDSATTTTGSFCYDAYGIDPCDRPVTVHSPFRFASGMQESSGESLIKFGTRYYDPSAGRFTQRDPVAGAIADPGRVNRYSYVGDNPTNKVDPTGRDPLACIGVVFGAIGTAFSGAATVASIIGEAPTAGLTTPATLGLIGLTFTAASITVGLVGSCAGG